MTDSLRKNDRNTIDFAVWLRYTGGKDRIREEPPMLPCQTSCPRYCAGCHKTCAQWRAFQEDQRLQREAKKAYLKYYGELCAQTLRQLRSDRGDGRHVCHACPFPRLTANAVGNIVPGRDMRKKNQATRGGFA